MKSRASASCGGGLAVALVCGLGASARADEPLPSPLRLAQVLELARVRRPEIVAARARARAAGQRPAIVGALEDPTVTASINHLPFSLDGVDASFVVQQGFPLSRIRGHRARAAQAAADGLRAETDRATLDVELDAANAFLMLGERREMLRILGEQRHLAEQLVRASTARYAAGTGVQADVLRAEIELARIDGALRATRAEVTRDEAMLNTSLARQADLPVSPLESAASMELPPEAAMVRQAALDRRPELRAGRAEIDRARSEIAVMRSMYAPMGMVGTGPAYTMTNGPGWMLMLGLSVPIWRGKLRAGVDEAQAMADMARADLDAMKRMVDGEAAAARAQVLASRERFLALHDEIVPRAQQTIDPMLASYASGQVPLVSVLDAARALWMSQMDLVEAEAALGVAWARLQRATGHGGRP